MSRLSDLLNPVSSAAASPQPLAHVSKVTDDPVETIGSSVEQSRQPDEPLSKPESVVAVEQANPAISRESHDAPTHAPVNSLPQPRNSVHPSPCPASPTASSALAAASPIEPCPPLEQVQLPYSPTLEQYHHRSGSPTWEERQSQSQRIHLAPINVPSSDQQDAATSPDKTPAKSAQAAQQSPAPHSEVATKPEPMDDVKHTPQVADPENISSAPLTSQNRQPSPTASIPLDSVQAQIKSEASATPREAIPVSSQAGPAADLSSLRPDSPTPSAGPPSAKAIADFMKDAKKAPSREASTSARATPTPTFAKGANKGHPPAKTASAVSKKGSILPAKTGNKKRKLESDSLEGTPSSKRSATPVSSRASKTPAANRKQSSTPAGASSSPAPAGAGADGGDVFCICRRPDDHTWMIGCDGGCEDWFHGNCVSIKEEDGDLIDKYICEYSGEYIHRHMLIIIAGPNCAKDGKGNTTWKPMCRLEGCRQPARLIKNRASKYCCDEHGNAFMHGNLPKDKKRKRGEVVDEDESTAMGGVLSRAQLAAISTNVKDAETLRSLGEGVLSPPPTADPDRDGDVRMEDEGDVAKNGPLFNDEEQNRLADIEDARQRLNNRKDGLKAREQFVQLVRARAKRVLAELPGLKDICGFDSRLSWTEEEFWEWKESDEGRKAFETGELGHPSNETLDEEDHEEESVGAGVCQKKRCERHKQWRNIQLQDIRAEEHTVATELDALNREELEWRQRAKLRRIREADGEREGRVEVVEVSA